MPIYRNGVIRKKTFILTRKRLYCGIQNKILLQISSVIVCTRVYIQRENILILALLHDKA